MRLSNINNIDYWSEQEENLLIESFFETPNIELIKLFPNRTLNSIQDHARLLGLKRGIVDIYPPYSKEEDEILLKYYKDYGISYCKDLLKNRTYYSIKTHANKSLGLTRGFEKFTKKAGFDLQKFEDFYKLHSIKETANEFNLKSSQVSNIAHQNNLKRDKSTIKHEKYQKIYCVELDKIFNSLLEIKKQVGINTTNITDCCNKKRKTTYGYHWEWVDKKGG